MYCTLSSFDSTDRQYRIVGFSLKNGWIKGRRSESGVTFTRTPILTIAKS